MLTAVLFDLDETLLDRTTSLVAFLTDQHARFGGELGCSSFPAWRDRFLALDARGHVHKSIVYPSILREFDGNLSLADELLADYLAGCPSFALPFDGMVDTLHDLRSRGLRLGIITNGETQFQSRHVGALGLEQLVDVVLVSQSEGLRKPDAVLFHRAAERLNVQPAECLFVGDNPVADILGAHAAGMKTAWFRSGLDWPEHLPPSPGPAINKLSEVLAVIARTNVG